MTSSSRRSTCSTSSRPPARVRQRRSRHLHVLHRPRRQPDRPTTPATRNGPRGAANDANLARQRDKIVAAINTADADIVSLEELENSVKFDKPRDFAIDALVTALNADAGPGTWAAVPSPAPANLPPLAEQDVIRNGFIYKPGNVALVGGSVVLADESTGAEAFANAREPLAQAFKAVGTPRRRRVRGDRQPLQVQGLRARRTPTARATPTTAASCRPTSLVDVRRRVQDAARHQPGLPGR